ncbi:MAG: periplasmic heavy metal sensor [Propionivibrio sp.]
MKQLLSPRILVAAAAFSLGLAANSYAMPRGEHPGPGMGMPGHYAIVHDRAMNRLHGELNLDAKQEALWQEAEKFSQDHRDTMRERFRKERAEIKAMLDQPGADLRAIAKRTDDLRAEGIKERNAVRERWLAVYDTLNPEQKEKARLFFKAGAERFERMGQKAKGRGQPPRDTPANPAPKS